MLLFALFVGAASGLSKTPAKEARLLLSKSLLDDVPEENASKAAHDVFNASFVIASGNTTNLKEDPQWREKWWKDSSRTHPPAKNLRARWKSGKPLRDLPEEPMSVDHANRRIIFLFMVTDTVYHPDHWNAFFEGANPSQFSAYVHCKEACNLTMLKKMPALKPVDIVPTHYCHNLVDAMVSLLKGAVADGGTKYDKFIFVSDSTLPAKPFEEIFYNMGQDDDSDFCIFPSDHWAEADYNNKRVVLVKHHQWVVLNYQHAQEMVRGWGSVDAQGEWSVPIRTPTYSEPLIYNAERFTRQPIANWCADEWAIFATIFGAIPEDGKTWGMTIPGYHDRNDGSRLMLNGPSTDKMQGRCHTFAFWSPDMDPEAANLAQRIAKGHPDNELSCWPTCTYRPAEVEKLSAEGLAEIRGSPFMFARKFSRTIKLPAFRDVILQKDPSHPCHRKVVTTKSGVKVNTTGVEAVGEAFSDAYS